MAARGAPSLPPTSWGSAASLPPSFMAVSRGWRSPHELGFLSLYSFSDFCHPSRVEEDWAYLDRPDSESVKFYI
jgi:hypothetical protein